MLDQDFWGAYANADRSTIRGRFLRDAQRVPAPATATVLLATLISNLMAMALPVAILIIYDRVIPNATEQTLLLLLGGVLVALLVDVLIRIARGYIVTERAARYGHRAVMGSAARILFADPRAMETLSTGQRLEQLAALDTIRESRSGSLPQLIVDLPFFVLFVAAVFVIGAELGYVLIAAVAVLATTSYLSGRSVRDRTSARQQAERSQTNFLLEALQGMVTIKTFAMERLMVRRYERVIERSAEVTRDLIAGSGFAQATASWITQIATATVVGYGSIMVIEGRMTVGGIAACMLLAGRAMQPMNRAALLWSQYQSVHIAKQHARKLAGIPLVARRRDQWLARFRGQIEFRAVDFGYRADAPVLRNVTFAIAAGEAVAVSGRNWAGKSTLLAVLSGILKPDAGQVLYDGVDGAELNDVRLREAIAYLPQEPALFDGSILENVCAFDMSAERISRALAVSEELGLTEAVSRLAKGFGTPVSGATADTLPASLCQLIPIVRGLARDPSVIVMDECNSNLDKFADDRFRHALQNRKGSATIVMVSQRPSFLALCDRTLDLSRGADAHRFGEQPAMPPRGSERTLQIVAGND